MTTSTVPCRSPTTTATPVVAAAATAATAVVTAAAAAAAAAIATATATTAAVSTTTTATATGLTLLGLIHAKRATIKGLAIHAFDCLGRFLRGAHRDEREAAAAARLAIGDEVDITDGTELLEGSADTIGGRVERKISNVQTSVHQLARTGPMSS
jgi:hypothetical protein